MAVTRAGTCNIPVRQQNGARNWQTISIRLRASSVAPTLACPPEIVFDQGLGDLFVVRVAGNVINDEGLGSLEYRSITWVVA